MAQLTLYIYPSPFGVNWKSPLHLTRSVILNAASLKPRTIGHVSVELEGQFQGKGERFFTGMSSNNQATNRQLIFLQNKGLGVLFHQYPGYLEAAEKLDSEKEKRLQNGNFSFIRFQLSQASYEKARLYLHEYQARKVDRHYGLPHRPRHAEGAGCSAFATSFVEVAGVMKDEFRRHWSMQVKVPEAYLENVPVWRLLFPTAQNQRWANEQEAGKSIFFWDPDLMHGWIQRRANELQSSTTTDSMRVVYEKNTRGILVDSSKITPTNEPIWFD